METGRERGQQEKEETQVRRIQQDGRKEHQTEKSGWVGEERGQQKEETQVRRIQQDGRKEHQTEKSGWVGEERRGTWEVSAGMSVATESSSFSRQRRSVPTTLSRR